MTTRHSDDLALWHLLRESRRVLSRHKRRALGFFCITMGLVVIGLLVCPRKYISETRLFVRVGRESIGLDPTATTGQTLPVNDPRENEITSVLDILESRVVLERVVDRLGPSLILDGIPGDDTRPIAAADQSAPSRADGSSLKREKAIVHLSREIETIHTKKSNVIGVGYRDRSPELAQQVLRTFVEEFQAVHIGASRTHQSSAFFEGQANLLRGRFEIASKELNLAKDKINAVSVQQRRVSLQNHLSTIETAMLTSQADLDATDASVRGLDETLARLPKTTLTQEVTGFPDGALGSTRKRLYELELHEQELLSRYTEIHPLVVAVRRQASQARRILDAKAASPSQATSATNPVYQQLRLKQLEQQSASVALRARISSLRGKLTDVQEQVKSLNASETEIAQLQTRVDLLLDKYNAYSEKLEQARIDQALEDELISNINVVQPPTFVTQPVSPRKALVLVLGFLFATTGAISLAFFTEYMYGTLALVPVQPDTGTTAADPGAPKNEPEHVGASW